MATMAAYHVSVVMGQVATTSLPRYSHFFFNYIIPSHYDQMLFFSVYGCTSQNTDTDFARIHSTAHDRSLLVKLGF